jgi:hypothetical protein
MDELPHRRQDVDLTATGPAGWAQVPYGTAVVLLYCDKPACII